jgi:hypothetical protein
VVGLGAGVLASYGRAGDVFRFYEINPLVADIANSEFTFLQDCAADKAVVLGDARLVLEREASQQFDLLAVDAFSGDAIPLHLLTRQAFKTYARHLKPMGLLAIHISNQYLDLEPVIAEVATLEKRSALVINDGGEGADYLSPSKWVLVTANHARFDDPVFRDAQKAPAQLRNGMRPWTDDYSNLIQILK